MIRPAPLVALLLAISGDVLAAENPDPVPSVGVATMLENGTILVGIRGPAPGGPLQAVLMVEPGDTNYQQIIDHLGGLKPGETKSIPPWPGQAPKQPDKPAESPAGEE
ncbi:MAG TPA: hypothetical protein VK479_16585 [Micropepsaceae bacterium]|nr:hypothetical protein [Micropepsaceae bacterium]